MASKPLVTIRFRHRGFCSGWSPPHGIWSPGGIPSRTSSHPNTFPTRYQSLKQSISIESVNRFPSHAIAVSKNGTNEVLCPVQGTRTFLSIQLYARMHAHAMNATISAARQYIEQIWKAQGHDGWIPATHDPFRYSIDLGVSVFATRGANQHLTWGILDSALRGLEECLIRNSWYQNAMFRIFDSNWGQVGDGSVVEAVAAMIPDLQSD